MFDRAARAVENLVGHPASFIVALALVLLWAVSGPLFGWSEGWQLVVNTGTTIVTFLLVFLIQGSQTRDTKAIHAKLDELIRVTDARNEVILAEEVSREELNQLREQLQREAR